MRFIKLFKPEIIIVGNGGHALSCVDIIESAGVYKIKGFISNDTLIKDDIYGYPILGCDSDLKYLKKFFKFAFIGIGQTKKFIPRLNIFNSLVNLGYKLPTVVSPNAYVSSRSKIGSGVIIMHGVTINAGVSIGSNCIINSQVNLDHGVTVGDHCHISTGAILNGNVQIGSKTFIGSNVSIRQDLNIKESSFIQMGSCINSQYQKE
jgi:sugar O-acyltransferase (sialic acid O-acetyltransferase NeuD family)